MENFIDKQTLKYGFCSYFAQAYNELNPSTKIVAIMEHDIELDCNYLVHVVLRDQNGTYFDSLGQYEHLTHSIMDIADVEYMSLYAKEITPGQLTVRIFKDFHEFNEEIYTHTLNFIRENI